MQGMGLVLDAEGMLGTKRSKRYVCLVLPLSGNSCHFMRGPSRRREHIGFGDLSVDCRFAGLGHITSYHLCADVIQWCTMLQVQCSN